MRHPSPNAVGFYALDDRQLFRKLLGGVPKTRESRPRTALVIVRVTRDVGRSSVVVHGRFSRGASSLNVNSALSCRLRRQRARTTTSRRDPSSNPTPAWPDWLSHCSGIHEGTMSCTGHHRFLSIEPDRRVAVVYDQSWLYSSAKRSQ